MKKTNNQNLAAEWFARAGDDELSSEAIVKEGGSPRTLCFLSQQMAEKYLKGVAIFFGIKVEKVHDLLRLADLVAEKIPEIEKYRKTLALMNRYYIGTRYPGSADNYDWPEAKEAFAAAKNIKKLILQIVGL